MSLCLAPRVDEFERVEGRDPVWSAVHLAAACAWCATLALAKAPEGIAFAGLAAVALVRLPSTWRLYGALLGSPAFVALAAMAAWGVASLAWSSNPHPSLADAFPRSLLLPLLLWPLAHRWSLLLCVFTVGVAGHSAQLVVRSWNGEGFDQYNDSKPLIKHLASAGMVFAAGALVPWAALLRARGAARVSCLLALLLLIGGGLAVLSVRASLASFVAGSIAAALFAFRGSGPRPRLALRAGAGLAVLLLALGLAALESSRFIVWWRSMELASARAGGAAEADRGQSPLQAAPKPMRGTDMTEAQRLDHALQMQPKDATLPYLLSSGRMPMWRGALEIWREHPLLGAGAQSWSTEYPRRVLADPGAFEIPASELRKVAAMPGAHCAYLQELCERGVVGLGLLLALLVSVARGLWRAAGPWDAIAAFAIFVSWIAGAMVQSQSTQGLAMLLLGLLLVRACVPTRPCLRR